MTVPQGRSALSSGYGKPVQWVERKQGEEHLKASIREGLLVFESLFDEVIKALEKEGRKEPRRRGREIKVE